MTWSNLIDHDWPISFDVLINIRGSSFACRTHLVSSLHDKARKRKTSSGWSTNCVKVQVRHACDMHATCMGHAWQGCKWWSHINIFILVKAITRYSYGMTMINLDCRTPVTGTSLLPSQHWAVSWRNCTTIIYHPDLGTHSGSRDACSLIFPGAHDHS